MYHGRNLCFKAQKVLWDMFNFIQSFESPSEPIFLNFEGNRVKISTFQPIFRSNACEMLHVHDLTIVGQPCSFTFQMRIQGCVEIMAEMKKAEYHQKLVSEHDF